jgi:segregation and condensation protein B
VADECYAFERRHEEVMSVSEQSELRGAIEALLFVADAPIELTRLAAAVQQPVVVVAETVAQLAAELEDRQAGVELRRAGDGLRLYTRERYCEIVEGFLLDGQRARLSPAALETLAVIAYRQPVTRSRVSAIRGVSVDGVIRTLLARGMITEAGMDPDTGGGLYQTTPEFLERIGLTSLDELPSLAPMLPELDTVDTGP